jgi:hypothetical protein
LSWHLTINLRNLLAHIHNILWFIIQNLIGFFCWYFPLLLNNLVRWNNFLSWSEKHWSMKILAWFHDLAQGLSHLVSELVWSKNRFVSWVLHVRTGQLIELCQFILILISVNLIFMNWLTNWDFTFKHRRISLGAFLGRNFWHFGIYSCALWQLLFWLAGF